mmetsp:Transcript_28283/g.55619  ORF Transcript_28283/g.55619 Transcript_28283/m.55619 type:complete len:126 (+) Transcript_28283:2-379(+)
MIYICLPASGFSKLKSAPIRPSSSPSYHRRHQHHHGIVVCHRHHHHWDHKQAATQPTHTSKVSARASSGCVAVATRWLWVSFAVALFWDGKVFNIFNKPTVNDMTPLVPAAEQSQAPSIIVVERY